jgi:hypothetical protein
MIPFLARLIPKTLKRIHFYPSERESVKEREEREGKTGGKCEILV